MRYVTILCLALLPLSMGDATAAPRHYRPAPSSPGYRQAVPPPASPPVYNSPLPRAANSDIPGRNPAAGAIP